MIVFEWIWKFFAWLFMLNMTSSEVTLGGAIIVRIVTFAISYTAVGALFDWLDWFNSRAMHLVYFIISTIVSFVLCYIVMLIETYWKLISIIFGIIICIILIKKSWRNKREL